VVQVVPNWWYRNGTGDGPEHDIAFRVVPKWTGTETAHPVVPKWSGTECDLPLPYYLPDNYRSSDDGYERTTRVEFSRMQLITRSIAFLQTNVTRTYVGRES